MYDTNQKWQRGSRTQGVVGKGVIIFKQGRTSGPKTTLLEVLGANHVLQLEIVRGRVSSSDVCQQEVSER